MQAGSSFRVLCGRTHAGLIGNRTISFSLRCLSANNNKNDVEFDFPKISWYPGHIAKAEKELRDNVKQVDVVIEVRDCRIPISTTHPSVPQWVGNKPIIVVMMRIDQVPFRCSDEWKHYFRYNPPYPNRFGDQVFFIDGKKGDGITELKEQILFASQDINTKRVSHGIKPRAVRAMVIGYPNVGKSALINRILGRRLAKSKNTPGVTRSLQWVRIGAGSAGATAEEYSIELMDTPGIIPAKHLSQENAVKLAICNDIGAASYDNVSVASVLCDIINSVHMRYKGYVKMDEICNRYKLPFDKMNGDAILARVSDIMCQDSRASAADKLLGDFRSGRMGYISLESPRMLTKPDRSDDKAGKGKMDANGKSVQEEVYRLSNVEVDAEGSGKYDGW